VGTPNLRGTKMLFTPEHEWIIIEDGIATVGITDHAQDLLGDIVFVDLPQVGDEVSFGEDVSTVESVKAASDVYCPMSGTIVEINEDLLDSPEMVNGSPLDSWFFKIEIIDESESDNFMDEEEYISFIQ
jgi:glycine cleavage system H protein